MQALNFRSVYFIIFLVTDMLVKQKNHALNLKIRFLFSYLLKSVIFQQEILASLKFKLTFTFLFLARHPSSQKITFRRNSPNRTGQRSSRPFPCLEILMRIMCTGFLVLRTNISADVLKSEQHKAVGQSCHRIVTSAMKAFQLTVEARDTAVGMRLHLVNIPSPAVQQQLAIFVQWAMTFQERGARNWYEPRVVTAQLALRPLLPLSTAL